MAVRDESIPVACISFEPWKFHKLENAERLEHLFHQAVALGARIVVAPEGALDGYVLREAIDNPLLRSAALETAEPINGECIKRLARATRLLKASLVFGLAERTGPKSMHTAAVFIGPSGRVHGIHRKLHFAEGNHSSWYFSRMGQQLRSFDTPYGRVGMMLCHDRWDPLIARGLVLDGARLLIVPTHGNRSRLQDQCVIARARENGVPLIQSNVGLNIIISNGELVARDKGKNTITLGTIVIPAAPSRTAARRIEAQVVAEREDRMEKNFVKYMSPQAVLRRQHDTSFAAKPIWRRPRVHDYRVQQGTKD